MTPDGTHYVLYIYETKNVFVIALDGTFEQYDLSDVWPVYSAVFDFEALSDTELLLFDSASFTIYRYNLLTEAMSEYIPYRVTDCTYSRFLPSRSMLRPLTSDKLVFCGWDSDSRFIGTVDLQSGETTIVTYIHFPVLQQNIQPWVNVVINAAGEVYALFFANVHIDNYPESARNDPYSFVMSRWDSNSSSWQHTEVPTAQFGDREIGQFVGVDDAGNYYFYGLNPSRSITIVKPNGRLKAVIAAGVLGEHPNFIGIYPDGSIGVVRREQWDSTVGLTIETIMVSDIVPTPFPPAEGGSLEPAEQYTYLVSYIDGSASLNVINPVTLQTTTLSSIPITAEETITHGFLSPSGEWLAYTVSNFNNRSLDMRLLNLHTQETVSVIEGFKFPERPLLLDGDFAVFAWSSNSQYLAFHQQSPEDYRTRSDTQATYLYHVGTRTLTNITPGSVNQYQLSWSNGDSRLAVVSMDCTLVGCSRATLDVYDAHTAAIVQTVDLSALAGNDAGQSMNFRALQWSPDDRYIALLDSCAGSAVGLREVQLIDVDEGTLAQVTHFTPTDIPLADLVYVSSISLAWDGNNHLLIGADIVQGRLLTLPGSTSTATYVYDLEAETLTQIAAPYLSQWSPANEQLLAYLSYDYVTDPVRGKIPTNVQVQTAMFDGQLLTPLASAPPGCRLAWNRSGSILAYIEGNSIFADFCTSQFNKLDFVMDTTVQSVTLPPNALALGWLRGQ
ncbi:MAG: hypothetical protein H6671_17260 [Anaerolineaceae bacterium]|nr:hypothetical protein [Anaerolineaceae bacterium]